MMKPFSDEPIKASTPGLDAMAARQNEPIRASTPGLDAMKAESDTPLLEKLRAQDREKEAAAADKLAEGKAKAQANRDARKLQRGLKRAEITGRVNNFVRDWANQNAAVNKAVNASGQTISVAELPGIGMLDVASGKLVEGPLFQAPTSRVAIPPEASGGGSACIGLNLYVRIVGQDTQVWVGVGTVAGELPSGFDQATGKSVASSGSGQVWAEIEVNSSGEITSRTVQTGSYTSDPKRYILGNYVYNNGSPQVVNYGCGSIDASICRNWYASEAPFYSVVLTRCGCSEPQQG